MAGNLELIWDADATHILKEFRGTPVEKEISQNSIASIATASFRFLLVAITTEAAHPEFKLTLVNDCNFTIYPAIQPNAGLPVLEKGGFSLPTRGQRSFPGPTQHWSGRIWARTGCTHANGRFHCGTGDCDHRVECEGLGGATPATLAQFSLSHGPNKRLSSYGVTLVDGFNVPMTITPHEGKGLCPVVGCSENLLHSCPEKLKYGNGPVVGCKSGCEAFGTDEMCCRNHYKSPQTCRASGFSKFIKQLCPNTFTYAHDSPDLMHECYEPKELKVIFCHLMKI